jgi:hypothetical protein
MTVSKKKRGRPPNKDRSQATLTALGERVLSIDIEKAIWGPKEIELGSAASVASVAKCSRQAVHKLRENSLYLERLNRGLSAKLADQLTKRARRRDEKATAPDDQLARILQNPRPYLHAEIRKHWTGPVVSPLDGKTYATPERYLDHLVENKSYLLSILPGLKPSYAGKKTGR